MQRARIPSAGVGAAAGVAAGCAKLVLMHDAPKSITASVDTCTHLSIIKAFHRPTLAASNHSAAELLSSPQKL